MELLSYYLIFLIIAAAAASGLFFGLKAVSLI